MDKDIFIAMMLTIVASNLIWAVCFYYIVTKLLAAAGVQ